MNETLAPIATLPTLDFNDVAVAFESKSDKQLAERYLLFRAMNNPTLTKLGTSLLAWAIRRRLPIKGLVKATIFKQFCGGETIEECLPVVAELGKANVKSILDYSVEGEGNEASFDSVVEKTLQAIELSKREKLISFAVFKMTGIARFGLLEKVSAAQTLSSGEVAEWARVKARLRKICDAALEADLPVMIDAEESWIQAAIDSLADEMMERYNKHKPLVYNTIQLYRKDRLAFLKASFAKAEKGGYYLGAKLVRGAYMEKERERAAMMGYPSPIHDAKEATDRDFNLAIEFCVERIDRIGICAGTHNEESSLKLARLVAEKGLPLNHPRVHFSQLYGMGDHISYNLAKAGFNVAKYVPYGEVKFVLPYLIRRAQENTAVAGYASRELRLLIAERQRRKATKR
ncbi:MAG: proline dehydrogenase family protein [Chloroherpetonaceae bacterium]|nr:proline dehydrogenase family protein [Chloroherpetonaceae bacterium]MDW8438322.1 proline dehydrogenase family protein [Chloroherpetonaceae bacterium]